MINENELKRLLDEIQLVLLRRIKRLSEVAGLVDQIKLDIGKVSDEELIMIIATHNVYRKDLEFVSGQLGDDENELWDKLLHIDNE